MRKNRCNVFVEGTEMHTVAPTHPPTHIHTGQYSVCRYRSKVFVERAESLAACFWLFRVDEDLSTDMLCASQRGLELMLVVCVHRLWGYVIRSS